MNTSTMVSRSLMGAVGSLLLAAAFSPVAAQSSSRWAPYIGCWAVADDMTGSRLCIEPSEQANATRWISTLEDGQTAEEIVVVDGTFRPMSDSDCEGESAARFSDDGRRIYLDGSLDCDGTTRQSSGVIAMVSTSEWIDVRSLESDGRSLAWVQRYVRIDDDGSRSRAMARAFAAAPPEIRDIVDVSNNVSATVAAAWLGETGIEYQTNGADLIALDDAGVPGEVVDVVVALSNPQRFGFRGNADPELLDARTGGGSSAMPYAGPYSDRYRSRRYGYWGGFYGRASYYDDYFRYGSLGYNGYGAYDPWFGGGGYYRPTPIYVVPVTPVTDNRGRAINGRGYSQPAAPRADQGLFAGLESAEHVERRQRLDRLIGRDHAPGQAPRWWRRDLIRI